MLTSRAVTRTQLTKVIGDVYTKVRCASALRLLRQESERELAASGAGGRGAVALPGWPGGLCLADGWLNPKHEPCVASGGPRPCHSLPPNWACPLPRSPGPPGAGPPPARQAQAPAAPRCRGPLPRLGTVRLRPVRSAAERALWRGHAGGAPSAGSGPGPGLPDELAAGIGGLRHAGAA